MNSSDSFGYHSRAKQLGISFMVISLFMVPVLLSSPVFGTTYVTFSGTVYDQENTGIAGVVVVLNNPTLGKYSTTTDGSGQWAITIPFGQYSAQYFWQSNTNGPYLYYTSSIPITSSYTANVWITAINYNLAYEYPVTFPANGGINDTVGYTISSNLYFSVNASVSGSITDGFVGLNVAGSVGTTVTMASSTTDTANGYKPYVAYYVAGYAYAVEDINGNTLSYVKGVTSTSFSTANVVDYMSLHQAWDEANNTSNSDVVTSVASGQLGQGPSETNTTAVRIDSAISIGANFPGFGSVKYSMEVTLGAGASQTISVKFWNNSPQTVYFVVWQGGIHYSGGPDIHIYYLGTSI
jgi:hypothetical protein